MMLGAPGVVAGFYIGQELNAVGLRLAFVAILLILAVVILRQTRLHSGAVSNSDEDPRDCDGDWRELRDRAGTIYRYCVQGRMFGMMAGVFSGMCVGLVGLGGGEINTPALRIRCGMHLRVAISTSTAIMVGTGLIAVATRLPGGSIVWPAALLASVGTMIGSQLGSLIAFRISARSLAMHLVVIFVTMAALMFLQALRS